MVKRYLVIFIVCLVLLSSTSVFGKEFITISSAAAGGSWYPAGAALAQLFNEQLGDKLDINFSNQTSAGSAENIDILQKKEAEIAFLTSNVTLWAYEGTHDFEGKAYNNLRRLFPLFDSQYHFFVSEGVNNLQDLRKKKVVVGRPGSGDEISTRLIMKSLGMTYDDFQPEYLGINEGIDALKNGLVDGIIIISGYPVASVSDLMTTPIKRFKFLSLSDEEILTISKAEPWMLPVTILAGTYPNQPEDIKTVKHSSFATATVDMSEDLAYQIVKTTFENLDWLGQSYIGWKKLTLDAITEGFLNFTVPVHEGALKYYREMGKAK